eukprot:756357-Amphidinium_carterae.2
MAYHNIASCAMLGALRTEITKEDPSYTVSRTVPLTVATRTAFATEVITTAIPHNNKVYL